MDVHVYDKAKYHDESVQDLGLPDDHAANHTVFFLRWLIENDMMNAEFMSESGDAYRAGKSSIHDVYGWWDRCLVSDMLTDEGNAFAQAYFDFQTGKFLEDYEETVGGDLPSIFHVEYTEENYQRLKHVFDARFAQWKKSVGSSA